MHLIGTWLIRQGALSGVSVKHGLTVVPASTNSCHALKQLDIIL